MDSSNVCACVCGICVGYVFQRPTIPSSCPASFADLMRCCWIAEPKVLGGTETKCSTFSMMLRITRDCWYN